MRRTDIIGDIIGDRQSEWRGEARTLPKTNWQLDRATTSLTPYGMSFWALIFAACGGGGGGGSAPAGPSVSWSGHVYDGPIMGARVYVDADDDGQIAPGKDRFLGQTNRQGLFEAQILDNLKSKRLIVDLNGSMDLGEDGNIGGTGNNRDRLMSGTWLAPPEAKVVSPFTHMIATGIMLPGQIEGQLLGFDPLVDNPFGPTST